MNHEQERAMMNLSYHNRRFFPSSPALLALGLSLSRIIPITVALKGVRIAANHRMTALSTIRGGSDESTSVRKTYFLGVGSNMGDRYANIRAALDKLSTAETNTGTRVRRTSFLYETPPMYMTEQPPFLNAVVSIESTLEPLDLLRMLKSIERDLGRDLSPTAVRNGPRPVDLDILLCQQLNDEADKSMISHDCETLTIPHPRMLERAFVLRPLRDLLGNDTPLVHRSNEATSKSTTTISLGQAWEELDTSERNALVRVLPLPRNRLLYWKDEETLIMGVLNVTPDSFSDGGVDEGQVSASVQRCLEMERQGANVVDIGGESTRPGAIEVAIAEELQRTIPVIRGIREGAYSYRNGQRELHLTSLFVCSHSVGHSDID